VCALNSALAGLYEPTALSRLSRKSEQPLQLRSARAISYQMSGPEPRVRGGAHRHPDALLRRRAGVTERGPRARRAHDARGAAREARGATRGRDARRRPLQIDLRRHPVRPGHGVPVPVRRHHAADRRAHGEAGRAHLGDGRGPDPTLAPCVPRRDRARSILSRARGAVRRAGRHQLANGGVLAGLAARRRHSGGRHDRRTARCGTAGAPKTCRA
jgi:hypothetical protein